MTAVPVGKGILITRIRSLMSGLNATDVSKALDDAKRLSLDWISIKIADGASSWYNDIAGPFVNAFKAAGIRCWGWQFVYGRDPNGGADISVTEALTGASLVNQLGLEGIMIDGENQYEKFADNKALATKYIGALKARLDPSAGIGLCSFRFPSVQRPLPSAGSYGFPFEEFLAGCTFHIPQVYWEGNNQDDAPVVQLAQSIKELQAIKQLPFVGLGPACMDNGWKPTPVQIANFNKACLDNKLPGCSWFSWEAMLAYPELSLAVQNANGWNNPPLPAPVPVPPPPPGPATITDQAAARFVNIQRQMISDLQRTGDVGTYTPHA